MLTAGWLNGALFTAKVGGGGRPIIKHREPACAAASSG